MKNIIYTFLLIMIFIICNVIDVLGQDITVEKYKKNFDELKYIYFNYCDYDYYEVSDKISKLMKTLDDRDFRTKMKIITEYSMLDELYLHMIFSFAGNTDKASEHLRKARGKIKEELRSTSHINNYNQNFFNVKTGADDTSYMHKLVLEFENKCGYYTDGTALSLSKASYKDDVVEYWANAKGLLYNRRKGSIKSNLDILTEKYLHLERLDNNAIRESLELAKNTEDMITNVNYDNHYTFIYKLVIYYKKIFRASDNTAVTFNDAAGELKNVIDEYNKLIDSPNGVKVPMLNNYKYFFGDTIYNVIVSVKDQYSQLQGVTDVERLPDIRGFNYNALCLNCSIKFNSLPRNCIEYNKFIEECEQTQSCLNYVTRAKDSLLVFDERKYKDIENVTDTNRLEQLKDELCTDTYKKKIDSLIEKIEPTYSFSSMQPEEKELCVRAIRRNSLVNEVDFDELNFFFDSAFVNSPIKQVIVVRNIPDTTTYNYFLQVYRDANICKNDNMLFKEEIEFNLEQEINIIFRFLKTKNYLTFDEDYEVFKQKRRELVLIRKEATVASDKFYLFNKKALGIKSIRYNKPEAITLNRAFENFIQLNQSWEAER